MTRFASALFSLAVFHFCSGGWPHSADVGWAGVVHAQIRAAPEMKSEGQAATVDIEKPWGRIAFQKGFPSSLAIGLALAMLSFCAIESGTPWRMRSRQKELSPQILRNSATSGGRRSGWAIAIARPA